MLRGESIGGKWTGVVYEALPDGEVVYSTGHRDYQGNVSLVAKLDDGRWLHYGWGYGSCSGCDSWEAHLEEGGDRGKLLEEVRAGAAIMDPDHFADYLVQCAGADWLVAGMRNKPYGWSSYSFDEHAGLSTEQLISMVSGRAPPQKADPAKEDRMRAEAKNSEGPARDALYDYLREQGREAEMPLSINTWRSYMRRLDEPGMSRWEALTLWNGWVVSIQASRGNYSTPRFDGLGAHRYTAWEVAILTPGRGWFNVCETLPEVAKLVDFEPTDVPVAGYVPTNKVTELLHLLENTPVPVSSKNTA